MAKVLVADDSEVIRNSLKKILENAGHDVVSMVGDGLLAVEAYSKLRPDIVAMDINMPVMDGITAVENIMMSHKDAKIVMVSVDDERNKVFEALEKGAKHYVLKPIRGNTILKIIDVVLEYDRIVDIDQ